MVVSFDTWFTSSFRPVIVKWNQIYSMKTISPILYRWRTEYKFQFKLTTLPLAVNGIELEKDGWWAKWLKYDFLWFLTWIPCGTNALYCGWFHWNFFSSYYQQTGSKTTSMQIFCSPVINSSFLPVSLFRFQFENRVPKILHQGETDHLFLRPSSLLVEIMLGILIHPSHVSSWPR